MVVVLVFTLLGVLARAASAAPLDVEVRGVDIDRFPQVSVSFSIRSPSKLDFRRLQEDNVRVIEEEVPLQHFTILPDDTQMSVAMVLDDSGSQDGSLGCLKNAIYRYVDQMTPYDAATIVGFARGAGVIAPLTRDKHQIKDAVSQLTAYGATALYDGVALGLSEIYRAPGKKVVLVVTDGQDQVYPGGHPLSESTMGDLITIARMHRIEVYTVGIGSRVRHGLLRTLAHDTGGMYFYAPDKEAIGVLVDQMAAAWAARWRVVYNSPRAVEDSVLREVRLDVDFRGHHGSDVFGYQVRDRTDTESLVVNREKAYTPPTGDLLVFTSGLRDTPQPMRFYLYDGQNHMVRMGTTSPDGYGKLDARDPEMTKLHPGTYRLELEQIGTTLRYVHAGIVIEAGRPTVLRYRYSKVIFRRNRRVWYDTPQAYGDTSDLVAVSLTSVADGRTVYSGRLIDFKEPRETALWMEEGRYRVELSNLWPPSKWPDVEKQVLRNKLVSEITTTGSRILFFDVVDSDLIIDPDVLAANPPPSMQDGRYLNLDRPGSPGRSGEDPERSYEYRREDPHEMPAYEGPPDGGALHAQAASGEMVARVQPPEIGGESARSIGTSAPEAAQAPAPAAGPANPIGRLMELARRLDADSNRGDRRTALARSVEDASRSDGGNGRHAPSSPGLDHQRFPDGAASRLQDVGDTAVRPAAAPGALANGAADLSIVGGPPLGSGGAAPRSVPGDQASIGDRLRTLAQSVASGPVPPRSTGSSQGQTSIAADEAVPGTHRGKVFFGTEFLLRSYGRANPMSMIEAPSPPDAGATASADASPTRRVVVREASAAAGADEGAMAHSDFEALVRRRLSSREDAGEVYGTDDPDASAAEDPTNAPAPDGRPAKAGRHHRHSEGLPEEKQPASERGTHAAAPSRRSENGHAGKGTKVGGDTSDETRDRLDESGRSSFGSGATAQTTPGAGAGVAAAGSAGASVDGSAADRASAGDRSSIGDRASTDASHTSVHHPRHARKRHWAPASSAPPASVTPAAAHDAHALDPAASPPSRAQSAPVDGLPLLPPPPGPPPDGPAPRGDDPLASPYAAALGGADASGTSHSGAAVPGAASGSAPDLGGGAFETEQALGRLKAQDAQRQAGPAH